MFCPQALDWGNVADWAGAVGSVSAVGVALFIAFHESWSLKKERLLAEANELMRMAHLKGEVMRLLAEIETSCDAGMRDQRAGIAALLPSPNPWDRIDGVRFQLIAIQSLATADPRLFGLIGRAHAESEIAQEFKLVGGGTAMMLREIGTRMKALRHEVRDLD